MLQKITLGSDEEINRFYRENPRMYVVKYILFFNPATRQSEHHITYSLDTKMMNGQHLQKGGY